MLTFHAVRIQKLAVKGREGGMEGGVFAPGTVALRDGMGGGGMGGVIMQHSSTVLQE